MSCFDFFKNLRIIIKLVSFFILLILVWKAENFKFLIYIDDLGLYDGWEKLGMTTLDYTLNYYNSNKRTILIWMTLFVGYTIYYDLRVQAYPDQKGNKFIKFVGELISIVIVVLTYVAYVGDSDVVWDFKLFKIIFIPYLEFKRYLWMFWYLNEAKRLNVSITPLIELTDYYLVEVQDVKKAAWDHARSQYVPEPPHDTEGFYVWSENDVKLYYEMFLFFYEVVLPLLLIW